MHVCQWQEVPNLSLKADPSTVLVGHRGFPERYPENSLMGIRAALELGIRAIEIDVQASADGEPVVCHDVDLHRVAGRRVALDRTSAADLMQVSVHEPRRFGEQFHPCPLAHLRQVVELVAGFDGAVLFVELKEEIFARYARDAFLQKIAPLLVPLQSRMFIISFDWQCLRCAQQLFGWPVGWVLRRYDAASQQLLQQHPTDIVICDYRKLPPAPEQLWPGPWQWFIYDITDASAVEPWSERGVTYIETWDVETLSQAAYGS